MTIEEENLCETCFYDGNCKIQVVLKKAIACVKYIKSKEKEDVQNN